LHITVKFGTYVEQLGEGPADDIPEDWVRIRRLGTAEDLGDGKVGLVPTALLAPVPTTQEDDARKVMQQVSNRRLTIPAHVEEREKPVSADEEEEDEEEEEEEDQRDKELQQPASGSHAELHGRYGFVEANTIMHTPLGTESGHAPIPRANKRFTPPELSRPPTLVATPNEAEVSPPPKEVATEPAASNDGEAAEAAAAATAAAAAAKEATAAMDAAMADAATAAIDAAMAGNAEEPSPSRPGILLHF